MGEGVFLIRADTSSLCVLPLALSIASVTGWTFVEQYTIIEPIGKTSFTPVCIFPNPHTGCGISIGRIHSMNIGVHLDVIVRSIIYPTM